MFKAIVVTPAIVIVFMTLASFWLPPQASFEKLFLNGVTVISILLVYFSQLLPMLATSTPLIGNMEFPLLDKRLNSAVAAQLCQINKIFSLSGYSYVLQPHAFSVVHFVRNICHCHQSVEESKAICCATFNQGEYFRWIYWQGISWFTTRTDSS